jgi:hypothetical protein
VNAYLEIGLFCSCSSCIVVQNRAPTPSPTNLRSTLFPHTENPCCLRSKQILLYSSLRSLNKWLLVDYGKRVWKKTKGHMPYLRHYDIFLLWYIGSSFLNYSEEKQLDTSRLRRKAVSLNNDTHGLNIGNRIVCITWFSLIPCKKPLHLKFHSCWSTFKCAYHAINILNRNHLLSFQTQDLKNVVWSRLPTSYRYCLAF